MSLQKVISNYYTDLLDYLNSNYRKHSGDFDKYINSLNSESKKQLINKMASVFSRIYVLKESQTRFYKSKRRNYIAYITIFCIMIVISGWVIYYLANRDLTEGEVYTDYQRYVTMLTYLIFFMVLVSIFTLLIINSAENKKRVVVMARESDEDLQKMLKLFPLDNDEILLLQFIGFKYTESRSKYKIIHDHNKDLIDPYIKREVVPEPVGNNPNVKKKVSQTVNESNAFDYEKYFNNKRETLSKTIKQFYDNGEGYNTVRKEIVASSNVLILREFRNIMKYYYKIVKRKDNPEKLTDDKKIFDSLDKFVVKDLIIASNIIQPPNPNAYVDRANKVATQNPDVDITNSHADSLFVPEFNKLLKCFNYIIVYMYQFKDLKKANDPTFNSGIKGLMPQNIDVSLHTDNVEFYGYMKTYFSDEFEKRVDANLGTAKAASGKAGSMSNVYSNILLQYKDVLDNLYQTTMLAYKYDYLYPFDGQHMKNAITSSFSEFLNGVEFDASFATQIIEKIYKDIIPKCYKTYIVHTDIDSKKSAIVSRIAANIQKFNISVVQHQKYILGKVDQESNTKPDSDTKNFIIEMLGAVDRDVKQKKASAASTLRQSTNDSRFLELDQFIEELDKISYRDLKLGLNYEFYGEILDRFYFSVNDAIYGSTGKGVRDIYFDSAKKFLLGKVAMICVIVILCFIQIYHFIWWGNMSKYYDIAKSIDLHPDATKGMHPSNVKALRKDYFDEYVNNWMKIIIPIAGNVFIICLLISVYQKNVAKYNFNKETIDGNTAILRSSVNDMTTLFEDLDMKISKGQASQSIKTLPQIGLEEKTALYNNLKAIIDKFEKCNYVLSTAKSTMPFPYTEVIIDGFILVCIVLCLLFVYGKIDPLQRIKDIKVLNKLKEKGEYMDSDEGYANELISKASCHDSDIDSVMFTLKIIFFMFIVMFLIFYATKVVSSTAEYEWGIYNSFYFEESICLD